MLLKITVEHIFLTARKLFTLIFISSLVSHSFVVSLMQQKNMTYKQHFTLPPSRQSTMVLAIILASVQKGLYNTKGILLEGENGV